MKRYFVMFSAVLLSAALMAGCGPKRTASEDLSAQAPDAQAGEGSQVVVPDQKPMGESVVSEDLSSGAKTGGQYASITPGDDLTKRAESEGILYTVYFDFDNYTIRESDRDSLNRNATWLNLNKKVLVRIEGHADERGETEYNLALGDKRARSVKRYLEDLGIKADRLDTISFGEEKPADQGHDEDSWSRNRRAEFLITRTN